jgi:hypothetical protein
MVSLYDKLQEALKNANTEKDNKNNIGCSSGADEEVLFLLYIITFIKIFEFFALLFSWNSRKINKNIRSNNNDEK